MRTLLVLLVTCMIPHHLVAKELVDLTESELPGTTLGAIDVKCFASLHQVRGREGERARVTAWWRVGAG